LKSHAESRINASPVNERNGSCDRLGRLDSMMAALDARRDVTPSAPRRFMLPSQGTHPGLESFGPGPIVSPALPALNDCTHTLVPARILADSSAAEAGGIHANGQARMAISATLFRAFMGPRNRAGRGAYYAGFRGGTKVLSLARGRAVSLA